MKGSEPRCHQRRFYSSVAGNSFSHCLPTRYKGQSIHPSSSPGPKYTQTESIAKPLQKGAPLNQILGRTFDQKVEQFDHRDFMRIPWADIRWTFREARVSGTYLKSLTFEVSRQLLL
jgi:hypothetical protein